MSVLLPPTAPATSAPPSTTQRPARRDTPARARWSGANRYRLLDVLGHGATGVVHLAWDRRDRRYVAAKVLRHHDRGEATLRFVAEQRLVVDHPNVVCPIDWYQRPDEAVIIVELADAGTLRDVICSGAAIDPATAVGWLADVLAGLDHLHREGILHRDVKPGNVLLYTAEDGTVDARLGDLGSARHELDPHLTQDPAIPVGTISFLAPEVVAGGEHTEQSDLWAVGRTARELLDATRHGVPERVVDLVDALLREDPADRPASAGAALRRLGPRVRHGGGRVGADRRATRAVTEHRRRRHGRAAALLAPVVGLAVGALAWVMPGDEDGPRFSPAVLEMCGESDAISHRLMLNAAMRLQRMTAPPVAGAAEPADLLAVFERLQDLLRQHRDLLDPAAVEPVLQMSPRSLGRVVEEATGNPADPVRMMGYLGVVVRLLDAHDEIRRHCPGYLGPAPWEAALDQVLSEPDRATATALPPR